MKLLIINNLTQHLEELLLLLSKHDVSVIDFDALDQSFNDDAYDKIILTGSSWYGVKKYAETKYKAEIKLIKKSKKPILGICLGMQLIAHAYGEELVRNPIKEEGLVEITIIKKDKLVQRLPQHFRGMEKHFWNVENTTKLITIARSKKCVEILKHPNKEIYGVQFHPEIQDEKLEKEKNEGQKILENFLKTT